MRPEYKDYYKILGVEKAASEKDIKAAYRKMAGKYQTAANTGDKAAEEKLKEVNEAKEVLTDKDKRTKYDQYGSQWKAASEGGYGAGGYGAPGGARTTYSSGDALPPDLEEFFASMFGDRVSYGGGSRSSERFASQFSTAPRRESSATLPVTLEEAFAGVTRTMSLAIPGRYDLEMNRQETSSRRIEVKIPAGVQDGQKIRVAGQAADGGDLILVVQMQPHPRFVRDGDDLITESAVPYYRAALGGSVAVSQLAGARLTVTVPRGAQTGQRLRLTGQGMPKLRGGGRGDLFVTLKITVPKTLNEREQELLTELAVLGDKKEESA